MSGGGLTERLVKHSSASLFAELRGMDRTQLDVFASAVANVFRDNQVRTRKWSKQTNHQVHCGAFLLFFWLFPAQWTATLSSFHATLAADEEKQLLYFWMPPIVVCSSLFSLCPSRLKVSRE